MAVGGVTSGNASSIYGSRNVFSGLASGMDTESMIENAVSGLQAKITSLQQSKTKTGWKMEAYRNLTDAMVQFSRKYASYTSSTNLMSASFFNKAVLTTAQGANKDFITASGKSTSDVAINAVKQLATAARYVVKGGGVLGTTQGDAVIEGKDGVDFAGTTELSKLTGNLTFTYGSKTVSITFDEADVIKAKEADGDNPAKTEAQALADVIQEKLKEQKITIGDKTYTADQCIKVTEENGRIHFSDANEKSGNSLYISGASSSIKEALGLGDLSKDDNVTAFKVDPDKLVKEEQTAAYLSGKGMTINLNGVSKTIDLPKVETIMDDAGKKVTGYKLGDQTYNVDGDGAITDKSGFAAAYKKSMEEAVNNAFGDKLKLEFGNPTDGKDNFIFTASGEGNVLSITSTSGKILGLGDTTATSYLNTSKTLKDLLATKDENGNEVDGFKDLDRAKAVGKEIEKKDSNGEVYYVDAEGKRIVKEGEGDDAVWYRVDEKGEFLYDLKINDKSVGQFSQNTALESVLLAINNSTDAGVNVSYSKLSNQFVFTAKETGSAGRIDYDNDTLAAKLFGDMKVIDPADGTVKLKDGLDYTKGDDAQIGVTIDGNAMTLTRSTNNFDLDGLSITLKDTFNKDATYNETSKKWEVTQDGATKEAEAVTFKTEADADKIVDAIKSMIDDYNTMITDVKNAYSTMPNYKYANSGERYEPLTDADMEGMSETAIKNYEEKAKQGILFGDRDLSSMYNKLRNIFSPAGNEGAYLRSIGITTNYANGLTTVELDEDKLRDALAADPDKVRDVFTKSAGTGGATTDGIMQKMNNTLKSYAGTEGANKGILINKAGSKYAALSLLDNSLQKSIDNIEDEITKWQNKIADKVDYYTRKFSALEQLVAQMNNQSSYLAGMMSGGA